MTPFDATIESLAKALSSVREFLKEFNEDQPRNDKGEFAGGGGIASKPIRYTVLRTPIQRRIRQLVEVGSSIVVTLPPLCTDVAASSISKQ